jgi:cell volume regulation protein A
MLRFFDGFAWLSQITMFLTLGLLVFPSRIIPVMGAGIACSFFLMLIARPVGVLISLLFAQLQWREKILVSWVGLRGAVPIVLATFPLLAGIPEAESIFHVVFFIVLTSALLQAWSISTVARLLGLQAPFERKQRYPIEYAPVEGDDTSLEDLVIPFNAAVAGRPLVELGFPRDALIVLVSRNGIFFVPGGGTVLEEGDIVQVLVSGKALPEVREILLSLKEEEPE